MAKNSKEINIWLIVVTYNAEDWIDNCLSSVKDSSLNPKVVIIDNHSADLTTQIVKKSFPEFKLIENTTNDGFGRANNIGIKLAIQDDADFIFLLNQDAKLDSNTLQELTNVSAKHPEYGILSPLHLNYEGSSVDPKFSDYISSKSSNLIFDLFKQNFKEIYDFPFLPAAAWLVNCSALMDVGGFDPLFFMYGEDYDLCLRMISAGYKIGFVPRALAFHHHGGFPEPTPSLKKRTWFAYWETIINLKNPKQSFSKNLMDMAFNQISIMKDHLINFRLKRFFGTLIASSQVIFKLKTIRLHYFLCQSSKGVFINEGDG